MTYKCFDVHGYAHLYESMMEFYYISDPEATKLLYLLYTANLDSNASQGVEERNSKDFLNLLHTSRRRPYRTEVQFFKSMKALYDSIDRRKIRQAQQNAWEKLNAIMGEVEYAFMQEYGMVFEDKRTVYGKCVSDLIPSRREPRVCLLSDLAA